MLKMCFGCNCTAKFSIMVTLSPRYILEVEKSKVEGVKMLKSFLAATPPHMIWFTSSHHISTSGGKYVCCALHCRFYCYRMCTVYIRHFAVQWSDELCELL